MINNLENWIRLNKKTSLWIGVAAFLLVTNPTFSDFNNYLGQDRVIKPDGDAYKNDYEKFNTSKKINLFVFSIYKSNRKKYFGCESYYDNYYIGIAKNFFLLSGAEY